MNTMHGKYRKLNDLVRNILILSVFGSMMLLSGCGSESIPSVSAEPSASQPSDFYATLFMTGDSCISQELSEDASQNGIYDFQLMFEDIREESEGYDLKYYSQDTLVGTEASGSTCPKEAAEALIDDGFNLVSLANDDAMDAGEEGIGYSVDFWNSHPEVTTAGTSTSKSESENIPIHEVNGITYAFLSWTYGTEKEMPEGKEYLVNVYTGHEQKMLDQVKMAKTMVDVVIVAMHWGTDSRLTPDPDQMSLAVELSNAGADIIIGTHPYVIEAAAWINNNKTICFYSLGNLISSMPAGMPLTGINSGSGTIADERGAWVGMEAGLTIHKSIRNGETKVEITDVKTDLIYTVRDENNHHYKAVPFSKLTYEEETSKDIIYDAYKPYITMYDPTITIGMH